MSTELVGFENLPNAFIKEIKLKEYGASGVTVSVKIRVHDVFGESIWFDSSQTLTKLLRVGVYFSDDQESSNEINSGQVDLLSLKPIHTKSVMNSKEMGDNLVFDFHFSKIVPFNIDHLSVYSFCFIDKNDIRESVGINVPRHYLGPIKAEKIFNNGSIVDSTHVFLRQNGEYWSGPVHEHQGIFMAGAFHTDQPHETLTRLSVKNTKLKDLRQIEKKSSMKESKKMNIMSELFVSYNSQTDVNAMFMLNMKNLLLEKTKFGKFLRNASQVAIVELLGEFQIKLMTIERHRIKLSKQSTSLRASKKKASKIFSKQQIVKTSDLDSVIRNVSRFERRKVLFDVVENELRTGTNNVRQNNEIFREELTDYKKISEIVEMFFDYGANIRTFQFNDYSLTSSTPGVYQYNVKISFVDPTRKFLTNTFLSMKNDLDELYKLRSSAARGKNLDFSNASATNLTNSFVKNFSYIYNLSDREKTALSVKMINYIEFSTANLYTIRKFIEEYENLVKEFSQLTDYDPVSINSNSPSTSISSKEPFSSRISVEKTFEKIVEPSFYKTAFGYVNDNSSNLMRVLTKRQLEEAADQQNSANYSQQPTSTDTNLNDEANAAMNDLESGKVAYWSANYAISTSSKVSLSGFDASISHTALNGFAEQQMLSGMTMKQPDAYSSKQQPAESEVKSEEFVESGDRFVESSKIMGTNHDFVNYSEVDNSYNVVEQQTNSQVKFGNYFSGFQNSRTFAATIEAAKNLTAEEAAELPNQLKAVVQGETSATRNNYLTEEGDALANPNTKNYYELNNFSVQKLVYIDNFTVDFEGNIFLNKPIYKEMSFANFNLLDRPVICFLEAYTNSKFKITDENQLSVLDNVFIMSDSDLTIPRDLEIVESTTNYNISDLAYQFMNSQIIVQFNEQTTVPVVSEPIEPRVTDNVQDLRSSIEIDFDRGGSY